MPRLDGSGPRGEGAMTGRGLGNCNTETSVNEESNVQNQRGMGLGRGIGFGRGMGRRPRRGGFGRGRW